MDHTNQFPQMLYKSGGCEEIHGGRYDYIVVAGHDELEEALSDGWRETTAQADAYRHPMFDGGDPEPDDAAQPTRAELEQRAADLGIKVDGRWSDKRLMAAIEAA